MMDDDRNEDDFEGFFGGFDHYFQDMQRQMDEMSKHFEQMFRDSDIHIGFSTPGLSGQLPPLEGRSSPLKNDPRDQMLKEDSAPERAAGSTSSQITPAPTESKSRFWTWNTSDLFSDLSNPKTTVMGRMRSVQTIRREDGSVERIEKTTENGRTCTTVTTTDPNGVTTTTTTCDRPGVGNGPTDSLVPRLPAPPKSDCGCPGTQDSGRSSTPQKPTGDWLRTDFDKRNAPLMNTQLSKEDEGFFSKLFGNLGFGKPRS